MAIQHRDDEPCTTVHLPHGPAAANAARKQMADELRAAKIPAAVVTDAEIVIGELVSNAYEHGRPDSAGNIEISWCVHRDVIRLSVFDGGDVDTLRAQPMDPTSHRGRGLAMVDFICDNWHSEHDRPGTRVTAALAYG